MKVIKTNCDYVLHHQIGSRCEGWWGLLHCSVPVERCGRTAPLGGIGPEVLVPYGTEGCGQAAMDDELGSETASGAACDQSLVFTDRSSTPCFFSSTRPSRWIHSISRPLLTKCVLSLFDLHILLWVVWPFLAWLSIFSAANLLLLSLTGSRRGGHRGPGEDQLHHPHQLWDGRAGE